MLNPSLLGIDSAHGVRQVLPFEACASAPVGFEWMVTVPVEGESNRSRFGRLRLGMVEFAAQPASASAQAATATAALVFNLKQPNAIDRFPSPGPSTKRVREVWLRPSLPGSEAGFPLIKQVR